MHEEKEGWQKVRRKSSNSPVRASPTISPRNSFLALASVIEDVHSHSDEENMENYPSDPMHEDTNPHNAKPKRKIGRPRKDEIIPPHMIYNTRQRSISESKNIARSVSATTFRIDDNQKACAGMKSHGSWAYDSER